MRGTTPARSALTFPVFSGLPVDKVRLVGEKGGVKVTGKQMAQAVAETSDGAEDPNHVASLVGAYIRRQPMIGHYVTAHSAELGLEGAVLTLLHVSVLSRAIELGAGRRLRVLSPADLDAAVASDLNELDRETELMSYLASNLPPDDATLGGKRHPAAVRLVRVIAYALLERA